jgi:prepilin-type processing-associated H-X9-DG protein
MKCTDGFWIEGDNLKTNVRAVWGSGIGGTNKSLAFRAFPRGLTTMVAVDEIRAGVNSLDPRGVWALGFVGASTTAGHGIYRKCGRPNNPSIESDLVANCERVRALAGGSEALAAMGMGCKTWFTSSVSFEAGARSLHPGGVNLLMLGGSVHFVSDDVGEQVWHNMHRRDYKGQLDLPF